MHRPAPVLVAVLLVVLVAVVLMESCGGGSPPTTTPPSSPAAGNASSPPPGSPGTSPTSSSTVTRVDLPPGTPRSFADDLEPGDVPPAALVPAGTTPSNTWFADTSAGQTIVVTYVRPGADPMRQEGGLVVWRRFPVAPPWRAVFSLRHRADSGVESTQVTIGDATGDGSADAVVFDLTGGSGACGSWRVLDLAADAQVYLKQTCDAQIALSTAPHGLVLTEAVFGPGDSHCCPSSTRTSVLTYVGSGAWRIASTQTKEN